MFYTEEKIQIFDMKYWNFIFDGGYITKATARWRAESASKQINSPLGAAIYIRNMELMPVAYVVRVPLIVAFKKQRPSSEIIPIQI